MAVTIILTALPESRGTSAKGEGGERRRKKKGRKKDSITDDAEGALLQVLACILGLLANAAFSPQTHCHLLLPSSSASSSSSSSSFGRGKTSSDPPLLFALTSCVAFTYGRKGTKRVVEGHQRYLQPSTRTWYALHHAKCAASAALLLRNLARRRENRAFFTDTLQRRRREVTGGREEGRGGGGESESVAIGLVKALNVSPVEVGEQMSRATGSSGGTRGECKMRMRMTHVR